MIRCGRCHRISIGASWVHIDQLKLYKLVMRFIDSQKTGGYEEVFQTMLTFLHSEYNCIIGAIRYKRLDENGIEQKLEVFPLTGRFGTEYMEYYEKYLGSYQLAIKVNKVQEMSVISHGEYSWDSPKFCPECCDGHLLFTFDTSMLLRKALLS